MTLEEAIEIIKSAQAQIEWEYPMDYAVAFDMAISALQTQEVKQEVKKSGCTYKPDCPWYDGSKCNSPNDHGYHECDYDRGIFPESYEELSKNSPKLDKENGDLQQTYNQLATDTISRQAAIDAIESTDWYHINTGGELVHGANSKEDEPLYKAKDIYSVIENLPSAQPEIIHCKDCKWHNGEINQCNAQICASMCGEDFCSKGERREDERSD